MFSLLPGGSKEAFLPRVPYLYMGVSTHATCSDACGGLDHVWKNRAGEQHGVSKTDCEVPWYWGGFAAEMDVWWWSGGTGTGERDRVHGCLIAMPAGGGDGASASVLSTPHRRRHQQQQQQDRSGSSGRGRGSLAEDRTACITVHALGAQAAAGGVFRRGV